MDYCIPADQVEQTLQNEGGRDMVVCIIHGVKLSLPKDRLRSDGNNGYVIRDKKLRAEVRSAVGQRR